MNRFTLQNGCFAMLAMLAMPVLASSQDAKTGSLIYAEGSISGIIRDVAGIPQMGALVEALLPDASLGGSAITDSRGQYRMVLHPGRYRIRATAALLLPAIHDQLQVSLGARTVVNLTLSTILAPGGWLPVSRRTVNEPNDDWMWTLRSSASRSILRFSSTDDAAEASAPVLASSSRQESRRGATGGRLTLKESDGGFAKGGSHNVLVLTRVNEDGSGAVLRADFSGTRSPYPVAPSAEVSVGMQRKTLLNGFSRTVLSYSNHPELVDARSITGLQGVTLRSGQRIELGDFIRVDAGSVMRAVSFGGGAVIAEPFLRVATRPGSGVVLAYSMTHSRGTASLEDLDRVQVSVPVVVFSKGRLKLESGSHQAFSVAGGLPGGGTAEVAVYHDTLRNPLIAGTGVLASADLHMDSLVADPTTRTYRVAAKDYNGAGVRVSIRHPLTKSMQVGAEFSTGTALRAATMRGASMAQVLNTLAPSDSFAATAYLDGRVLSTGTNMRAAYRFQPARTLTGVDAFQMGDDGAFLSCSIRQSLARMRFLPHGLEALIDVQNLLAEGYQPFLSSDGRTLYLAQTPRTLQAGLSFSF